MTFFDYHSALASRPALATGRRRRAARFGAGASVVCDDAGVPTGMLREAPAMALVEGHVPSRTHAERLDAYAESLRRLNALGITGAHVMLGWPWLFDDVETLEARGDLTVRCVLPLLMEPDVSDDEVAGLLEHAGRRGRRWRAGVAKFFIDGVIDSGTGWLFEPGPHGEGTEPYWPDPARYAAVVAALRAGRAAVRDARDRRPGGGRGARRLPRRRRARDRAAPRRAHRDAARRRAAALRGGGRGGVDAAAARHGARRAGPVQLARPAPARRRSRPGFRWADLVRSGAILALGSDWPVVSADPRPGLAWARLRRAPGHPDRTPFHPEQALSAEQALAGYTSEAARIVGEAALGGRIAVGLRADLTGLGADPVDCPPDELPDVPVLLTVVDGEIVHRAA